MVLYMSSYKVYTVTPSGLKKQIVKAESKSAALRAFRNVVVARVFRVNEVGAIIANQE